MAREKTPWEKDIEALTKGPRQARGTVYCCLLVPEPGEPWATNTNTTLRSPSLSLASLSLFCGRPWRKEMFGCVAVCFFPSDTQRSTHPISSPSPRPSVTDARTDAQRLWAWLFSLFYLSFSSVWPRPTDEKKDNEKTGRQLSNRLQMVRESSGRLSSPDGYILSLCGPRSVARASPDINLPSGTSRSYNLFSFLFFFLYSLSFGGREGMVVRCQKKGKREKKKGKENSRATARDIIFITHKRRFAGG